MSTPESILETEQLPDPMAAGEQTGNVAGRSPMQLAMARFRQDKKSMAALVVVIVYVIAGIAAPILVGVGVLDPLTEHVDLLNANGVSDHLWGITWHHPLGVEPGIGRDTLSRLWYGITFSLFIAVTAALIAIVIGVLLGIIAGMSGGWVDAAIGRLIDLGLCFPQTIMLIALSTVATTFIHSNLHVPAGNATQAVFVIGVLAIFGWMAPARLIRGQVLSLREREFVSAAQLLGASRRRVWIKEILPNLWAPVLVNFTLMMPAFVSTEAALSYLGVSIKAPTPTLGNILHDAVRYAQGNFLYFVSPAILIALIVVAFNLLGDGLRDALDPKTGR